MTRKPSLSDCELIVAPEHQNIDPDKLSGIRPGRMNRPYHLFVVNHLEKLVLQFHSACVFNHQDIVERHGLDEKNIVGGGVVQLAGEELYVGGSSSDFSLIPVAFQRLFAEGLKNLLTNQGIGIDSIRTDTKDTAVFWRDFWKTLNRRSLQ